MSTTKNRDGQAPEGARARQRLCVGCQGREDLLATDGAFVRLVVGPGGAIAVDAGSGGFGRGAYVHPRPDCLAGAVARGLPRASKSHVHLDGDDEGERLSVDRLAEAIVEATDRRIVGLLSAAVRARAISAGTDAVRGAVERNEAQLLVVATDAAAAADLSEVRQAVAKGRAVAWGTKVLLGEVIGVGRTAGLGVLAVSSDRLAVPLAIAVRTRDACRGVVGQTRGRASKSGLGQNRPAED